MRRLRGNDIALISQDPMTSLNPTRTIGSQLREAYRIHTGALPRRPRTVRAQEVLGLVGMPHPRRAAGRLPAPAVRRHAATGDDRHRPAVRARSCSSRTSRPPRWTCRSRPRSSSSSTTSGRGCPWASCSSPTTWALSPATPTGWWSCTAGGWPSRPRPGRCSLIRGIATPRRCSSPCPPWSWIRAADLATIPGTPPKLTGLPAMCRFAPRCRYAPPGLPDRGSGTAAGGTRARARLPASPGSPNPLTAAVTRLRDRGAVA